jgi:RNA polymerase sigma factor (sigma-70 family)
MNPESPAARPDELLAHAGWLRALAATLVSDAASAEDLVQDTWLVALRRPPRSDRPLRPWLSRVVRNLASNRRRAEGRRTEHELDARLPSAPRPAEEIVGELEAQRALVEALLQLEEPLRSTLVLRYYRGLDASQIARRQGVPAGTVRWRLKRGIDELRGRLDARFGGSRSSWCLLLEPLALAKLAAAGSTGAVAGGALAPGVLLMSVSVKVAAAAAVLGIAGGWWWYRTAEDAREGLTASGPVLPDSSNAGNGTVRDPAGALLVEPAEVKQGARGEVISSEDLVVRVVDPRGEPVAQLPLRLIRTHGPYSASVTGQKWPEARSMLTNGEGLAVFRNVRSEITSTTEATWFLQHDVIFETPPSKVLDQAALAEPVVILVQPDSGLLDIRVEEIGVPQSSKAIRVGLRTIDPDISDQFAPHEQPIWEADLEDGSALFKWVETGKTWEVSAWYIDSNVPSYTRARGPVYDEERTELKIVLGGDHPVIRFRAVGPTGRFLAGISLDIAIYHSTGYGRIRVQQPRDVRRVTDEAGFFSIDIRKGGRGGDPLIVHTREGEELGPSGRAFVPPSPVDGLTDGGDIVLAEPPLLVSGYVVDQSGQPIKNARVVAEAFSNVTFTTTRPGAPPPIPSVAGVSGEDGSFALRGLLPVSDLRIHAEYENKWSTTISASEGEAGVILSIDTEPTFKVSGQLVLDPDVSPRSLAMVIQKVVMKPVGAITISKAAKIANDGAFSWRDIPSGKYEVHCTLQGLGIRSMSDILVSADVDMGLVDLRNDIYRTTIALVDGPLDSSVTGDVGWRPADSSDTWRTVKFEGSLIGLDRPSTPIDVWVKPVGYRNGILRNVVSDVEFVLRKPYRIKLVLRTDGKLPSPPYFLVPRLRTSDGRELGQVQGFRYFTPENSEVSFDVEESGRIVVYWYLERRVGTQVSSGDVLRDQLVEVEVLDEDWEQVLEIDLDAESVTRLADAPPW